MNRMTLPDREPANTAGSTAQDTGWASTIALGGFILVATAPTLIHFCGGFFSAAASGQARGNNRRAYCAFSWLAMPIAL
jgi:hypothetical protein